MLLGDVCFLVLKLVTNPSLKRTEVVGQKMGLSIVTQYHFINLYFKPLPKTLVQLTLDFIS